MTKHLLTTWGLALLFTIVFNVGCTSLKPGCLIEDKSVVVLTEGAVALLECEDPEAVRTDMKKAIDLLGLCDEVQTGPFADRLCPGIAREVTNQLAMNGIPAGWKCKATNAKQKLQTTLETACKRIPVKQPVTCK